MSQAMESARQESSGIRMYLLGTYYLLVGNVSLSISVFGVLLIILGATVVSWSHDVFAGMFGVWGATLVVFGLLAYTVLWANKQFMDRAAS